jgi:hypothetical protein
VLQQSEQEGNRETGIEKAARGKFPLAALLFAYATCVAVMARASARTPPLLSSQMSVDHPSLTFPSLVAIGCHPDRGRTEQERRLQLEDAPNIDTSKLVHTPTQ